MKSLNSSNTHFSYEVRIFSVSFFYSPPAWITCNIDDRRKYLVCTSEPSLLSNHGKDLFNEFGMKSRRQTNGLRKACRAFCSVAVQSFFM